jgi:hypothetical protein
MPINDLAALLTPSATCQATKMLTFCDDFAINGFISQFLRIIFQQTSGSVPSLLLPIIRLRDVGLVMFDKL